MKPDNMDCVSIKGLTVETIIGIRDWERTTPQTLIVDMELFTDIQQAARTDDINNTLSYSDIARAVTAFIAQSRCNLIEALAEQLATLLMTQFDVAHLKLTVNKPGAVKNAMGVSVTIERAQP